MSINNVIAQGFNPGAGLVKGQQIKNERNERNYLRKQQGQQRAQEWAMQGLALAEKIKDPKQRPGWVNYWYDQAPPEIKEYLPDPRGIGELAGMLGGPEIKPPQSRERIAGDEIITEDFDPSTGGWVEQSRGARWQEKEPKPEKLVEVITDDNQVRLMPESEAVSSGATLASQVDVDKKLADTESARIKAEEERAKLEGEQRTKDEIKAIAESFLELGEDGNYSLKGDWMRGGIKDVYGTVDGSTLFNIRPGTVDAEAQIDQLVSLLTLGNLNKMSGVLSDSDIKILAGAGTKLANKRLSDDQVLAELMKIADVMNNPSKMQIGGATVEFK